MYVSALVPLALFISANALPHFPDFHNCDNNLVCDCVECSCIRCPVLHFPVLIISVSSLLISTATYTSSVLNFRVLIISVSPRLISTTIYSSSILHDRICATRSVYTERIFVVDQWTKICGCAPHAHASGIDGFALNVGRDDWQPGQVANAYNAASQSGTDFKLFLSFDMSSLPCASPDDAAALRKYITTYATHPNQATYNGRVLASTFSGETCTFGQSSPSTGWSSQFTQHPDLTGQNAVAFVPAFFVDPSTFGTFNGVMDGVLNWNSAWPVQLTTDFANNILSAVGASLSSIASSITSKVSDTLAAFVNGTTSDTAYINGLNAMPSDGQKRIYLATVSPWFFTHYSPQTFNKNRSEGWLDMTKYYADAFRTGAYPPVAEDKLYMWSRPHARDANAPDPVGKPSNFQLSEDTVWVVAMTTAPATVTLSTSDSDTQTLQVPAGANKLSVPISAGGFMHGSIQRNGQTVVDLKPDGFTFEGSPSTYNYNAFVAFAGSSQS
ncbi:hypothetical protein EWM64_g9028 [Hericium alpestre]|uniref:Glycoside hydrolase family 71 protein n=1 Tax=Hericium alpestre TaxID=135208 RepID=A0A4Y9ZKK4_9AGAM|nr:hypothetical protein EWM64_g9028 [Hericium alpestre]